MVTVKFPIDFHRYFDAMLKDVPKDALKTFK